MKHIKIYTLMIVLILSAVPKVTESGTLEDVKAKGYISVGVNGAVSGFSMPDEKGVWKGLDIDTARAISAAVFGDSSKVKYIALTAVQRFTAVQSGEIDVLCRNTAKTLSRDTAMGLNFAQPTFFDGQGFMVPKKLGVKRPIELDGALVCVLPGTTTELNAADFFRKNNMKWKPVVIETTSNLSKAFFAGRCDCITSDVSMLAALRTQAPSPQDYIILPEIISKEPFGPVVRHGDDMWYDIVNWTVHALIQAEEFGISSKNVDKWLRSKNIYIQRFLGVTPGMGKALGLNENWAYNIVRQVGNYGEIFERNLGPNTPLGLRRGLNELWINGGLMYAAPFK